MECKNFNNIKPNDSAWDQKKKKGDFFLVRGRGRELGGRYPLAGLCPAFMCVKKQKQKGGGKNADSQTSVSKRKSGAR